ncbi:unnamed protein product [Heterosigma akashiwo]|mmetsp:Transcript_44523/g.100687  ORF Transcript_44523/g.100687 Transcript_44523/m.100687 type:complete len:157 (+) Transcript_44523:68-538(+)
MLLLIDILASGFIFGATVWVFFIQSPVLFNFLGREKFVPPMMRLTKALFHWSLPAASFISVLCSGANKKHTLNLVFPLISLVSVTINALVVVPRALKAGKSTAAMRKGDRTNDTASFVVDGGAKSSTKFYHQSVVLFVLFMTAGTVLHLWDVAEAL